MRRAHILRDNKASDYPQQCIWFDTETDFVTMDDTAFYHKLKFGHAVYMRKHRNGVWTDEDWKKFTTRADFWDWVQSKARKQTKLYLFCHNTSFDLPVLDVFNELPRIGFILRSAIIDAPPTILRFRRDSECIMILDTLNIWRMPLKFLGEEIGLAKLDMPEDNDLGVTWDTYGKRDVEIIRDACIRWWQFLEDNDYGSFAPTLAGQAMHVFRHKYMRHQIFIDDNANALALTRDGYHGARCECFRIGKFKGNFSLLDVNSMYPSVMANREYPYHLLTTTRYASVNDIRIWLKSYCLTARVILRTSKPFAAVKNGLKLLFPIGEFECVLQTPEIIYALEYAEILKVIEIALYDKAYLFTVMMNDLYLKRLESKRAGNRVDAFLYRKLINSFYGKWGQSGGKWHEKENIDDLTAKHWIEYDAVTNRIIKHRQLGGLVQEQDTDAESRDSFPAIAGHITAYARMELQRFIELAGVDHLFYCDTDSVLVDEIGARNLAFEIHPELMGKLSLKGQWQEIEIWGAKDYRFGERQKTKGVRHDAIWLDDHNVTQCKWSGLRGIVSSGIVDKPITRTIRKHLARSYDKGTVLDDGSVLPLQMSLDLPQ
jgi:DNA polymerase type B, organellar and viral